MTNEALERCNQSGCTEPGAYRFTWPGQDEAAICEKHVGKLRGVASAMGLYIQVVPLAPEDAESESADA